MSIAEFMSMGGYGFYVWASFGMTALLIVVEVVHLKQQRIINIRRIRRLTKLSHGENK